MASGNAERYSSQQQILDTAAEFRKRKIPVERYRPGLAVLGKIRLERDAVRRARLSQSATDGNPATSGNKSTLAAIDGKIQVISS